MIVVAWFLFTLLSVAFCHDGRKEWQVQDRGPLYDYVYRADPNYSWFQLDTVAQDGFTTYYINMTSQQWYDETFSNRAIWWHYLVIHVPNTIAHPDAGFLYISGGDNRDEPPNWPRGAWGTGEYANATGIVTAVLLIVPNQPVIFENDGVERREDKMLAWTWKRFYNESHVGIDNPEVLARMPMCKAAARAMDTIQSFVYQLNCNSIAKFMVAGESKRGWTTWSIGGLDDRIVAIAPVVLSCLNMNANFHHYWRSWGGWSFTLNDYWSQGIMGLIDEPETILMQKITDPYNYRTWLTMPKLMISGASDEFFLLDDYDYFYDDLLGEKYIWIVENSGHGIYEPEYWAMLQTFFLSVLTNYQRPHMEWFKNTTNTGGQIVLLSPTPPLTITSFSALSIVPFRRDWRSAILGESGHPVRIRVEWVEGPVENLGYNYYRVQHDNPAEGYLAFFIKVTYPGPDGRVFHFTTEANIVPNTWPYADCVASECQGTLI